MKPLKYLLIAFATLFSLYMVAGFFLVPYLVTKHLPSKIKNDLKIQTAFKEASFNPLTFTLNIKESAILTEKNKPILSIKDFNAKLNVSKLFVRNISLDQVKFLEPKVHAIIDKKGNFNFFNLVKTDRADTNKTSTNSSWTFNIRELSIKNGSITFQDEQHEKPFIMEFKPIDYQAQNVGTSKSSNGLQKFSTTSKSVDTIKMDGNMTISPFSAMGAIDVQGLKIEKVWDYSIGNGDFYPKKSVGNVSFNYKINTTEKGLQLFFNTLKITLKNTELFEKKQKFASLKIVNLDNINIVTNIEKNQNFIKVRDGILNIKDINCTPSASVPLLGSINSTKLKNISFDYDIKSKAIKSAIKGASFDGVKTSLNDSIAPFSGNFDNLNFNGFTLELPKKSALSISLKDANLKGSSLFNKQQKDPFITIDDIKLESIATANNSLSANALYLDGTKLHASLEKNGSVGFLQGFAHSNATYETNSSSAFSYLLKILEAKNTSIHFQDKSIKKPFTHQLDIQTLKLANLSSKKSEKIGLNLQAKAKELPLLSFDGTIEQEPFSVAGKYKIEHGNLSQFQNYLDEFSNLIITKGGLKASGSIVLKNSDKLSLALLSNTKLSNVSINNKDSSPLISWKDLGIQKLNYDSMKESLHVSNIVLQTPKAYFIAHQNGSNNFENLIKNKKSNNSAKSNFKVAINGLMLENGNIKIQDNTLISPETIDIAKIKVNSSSHGANASKSLKFKGQAVVNKSGYLSFNGSLNPNNIKKDTRFTITTKSIDIPKIDGYTKTYLGRATKKGAITAKVTQEIKNGQLRGSNHIILEDFSLGASANSKKALTLPLDAAILLLRDGNGDVTLDVPVSGNMNDPQFSYGSVIVTAFTNIITGIVAAPFNILSGVLGIVGIEAEKLKTVDFEPLSTDIIASEEDKISKYAMILEKKKELKLTVTCGYNEKLDGKEGASKEELLELANQRTTAIKEALINAGITPERVIIKDIKQTASKDTHWVHCKIGIEQ